MKVLGRVHPAGDSAFGPLVLVAGAMLASGIIFFVFTRNLIPAGRPPGQEASAQAAAGEGAPGQLARPGAGPSSGAKEGSSASLPPTAMGGSSPPAGKKQVHEVFNRPNDLGSELMRRLGAGDIDSAARLLACEHSAKELAAKAMLEKLFTKLGYQPASPDQLQLLGQMEDRFRLGIPLRDPKGELTPGLRLLIDLERHEHLGWKVAAVHVPKELEAALAAEAEAPGAPGPGGEGSVPASLAAPASPPSVTPPSMKPFIVVDQRADALTFSSDFVRALLALDYDKVRAMVDENKVPPVKLAALCIVFEDGKYNLDPAKPVTATAGTETSSWIIVKLHSDLRQEETEFGLELELFNGRWRVSSLNLSKLLADNTKSSALVGIPYTPMVQNPKGGESIALYFEYNSDVLHPRAEKQLEVVARILKSASHKKLKIGGHTDAKGTDDYNLSLSQRRAVAVKSYILAQGVPEAQVETVGFGRALPLSPNVNPDGTDNPGGRSHNRRAEIFLDF